VCGHGQGLRRDTKDTTLRTTLTNPEQTSMSVDILNHSPHVLNTGGPPTPPIALLAPDSAKGAGKKNNKYKPNMKTFTSR
jgi:hypothetical protein